MTSQAQGAKPKATQKHRVMEHGKALDAAFRQIRELIVFGRLSPGSWIVEAELTEKTRTQVGSQREQ